MKHWKKKVTSEIIYVPGNSNAMMLWLRRTLVLWNEGLANYDLPENERL